MILHTLLLACSLTMAAVSAERYQKSILQPRLGYSTNVLHTNPDFKDLRAESSIKVDFHPQQSFNRGFGTRFTSGDGPYSRPRYAINSNSNKQFDNAEVITGKLKRNEKVRAPYLRHTKTPVKTKEIVKYPNHQGPSFAYNARQTIKTTKPEESDTNQAFASFNHAVAIKNSESFDFSHAHDDFNFGQSKPVQDPAVASSDHYGVMDQINRAQIEGAASPGAGFGFNIPQASEINNVNVEAHIPQHLRGIKPLPLDTSLLKKPVVLTGSLKEPLGKDTNVLPIHFDVRPLHSAMQQELTKVQKYGQNPYSAQASTDNFSYDGTNSGGARIYAKPEQADANQYNTGFSYGKDSANYEDDVYKIVSLRPPPIIQNNRY